MSNTNQLVLERKQWIPRSIEEVWTIFSDPENLNEMTPPFLHFEMLSKDLQPMHQGQRIEYRIEVLPKIKRPWVAEISEYEFHQFFVDEQRSGPYRYWHHRHQFDVKADGLWMTDRIHFQLPYGFLGHLFFKWYIRKRLKAIFDFRSKYLEKKFGASPALGSGAA